MKSIVFLLLGVLLTSCNGNKAENTPAPRPIVGTWKLLSGTLIEKGDTTVTDYTQKVSFIKIINDSHFSFIQHDLNGGKDSTAVFSAGAGTYMLSGDSYTEHLEYCSDRTWEGHDFTFRFEVKNDTFIQSGVEKIESAGIDRINIEKYVRVKR